jgi:hypothetical protein
MADLRDNLSTYINPFDRTKGYQRLAFLWDRYYATNQVNLAHEIEADRVREIGNALWKDGYLTSGGAIVLGAIADGLVPVSMAAAKVYIRGAIHDIAARTFSVHAVGTVFIGIRLRTFTVTDDDDPTLKGMAPNTRASGEHGPAALAMLGKWGWDGDGEEGDFFPIYTIKDGGIDTPEQTTDDTWSNLLARYDREAHGGYVVEGFDVRALGYDGSHQVFTISEGTINVWGFKRTRPAAYRMLISEEPELQLIDDEPHAVNSGAQTISVRFAPIAEVVEITIIAEKTVTLTHGAYTGVSDAVPDATVLSISQVKQNTTTYSGVTDFKLTGAAVDWSLTGAEPAPGSTYQVTYRYLTSAVPTNVQRDRFDIAGAADGTVALVKYRTKLPRYDAIVVDQAGAISYLKGISSLYAPQSVQVASTLVKIADVYNNWGVTPDVRQVGTVRMPFSDLRDLEGMVGDLYALVAEERLQRDVDRKEVSSKRGVFVDPLLDDDMRDQGIAQTGAIYGGVLWLPITPTVTIMPLAATSLPYVDEVILTQEHITGGSRINPYQVFDPPSAVMTLDPAQDLWTEEETEWTSAETSRVAYAGDWHGVNLYTTTTSVEESVLSSRTEQIETIRVRSVGFNLDQWGPNEHLSALTFDTIDVTPGNLAADAAGHLAGAFNIPANVPVGTKAVEARGSGGSHAEALYTAVGWKTTNTGQRLVITTKTYYDPVAQTFRLSERRQIVGVDLKFTHLADRTKPVRAQIREVDLGTPTDAVVAEKLLPLANVPVIDPLSAARDPADWVPMDFQNLITVDTDRAYAITALTADGYHEVAIADLGGFDQASGWVTSNAFPNGTFLDGSDARTWLAKPGRSLTFRLRAPRYTQTVRTIDVGTIAVDSATDLLPLINAVMPEGTAVEVEFESPDGTKYVTGPKVGVQMPVSVTGNMIVRLRIIGTATLSPVLEPWLQVVVGAVQPQGDYVSRAFTCGDDAKVRLIVDAYLPSTASFACMVQTAVNAGNPVWTAMTLEHATSLGDGWEERQYMLDHVSIAETRVKTILTGGPGARACFKSMRAVAVPSTTGA